MQNIAKRLMERYKLRVADFDKMKKDPENFRKFFKAYNESFDGIVHNFIPFTEAEIEALGIMDAGVVVGYEVGETIVVTSGAWKDTVGMIKEVNSQKQTLTIHVELFGRETPVEIGFSEVKKM